MSELTCQSCYHYKVCSNFGFVLDPLHGGVICEDFVNAADVVEVKHGRWVVGEKCNHKPCRIKNPDKWVIYKCSVCGYSNGRKQSNYCPNCGAKMDGE